MGKTKRICLLLLRLLALGSTVSAAIVMATSHEEARYFVIANSVASVYGFLVLFLPAESLLWRLVLCFDVIMTMLLTSSVAAALAVAQIGKNGNSYAGWLPICDQVANYCSQVTGALVMGLLGLLVYLLILLYSLHSLLDPLLLKKP
ncbi:CASP-like protein 1C1 [Cucumis melo var. makuwa]|uniref:CASP-like protein n=1 Tax=Cucumis melo var. makuwa TaxID=1194695 RepID=A0A5D3C5B2_CUCMM|nr:CASP-like protein 1C1 [Cucumis melo var. makuwa]TYK07027.1 CASP-like protein 1C1 [Cucumis melo var. makuwa]